MRTFNGRLWLVKDRYSEINVDIELDLDEEQLIITSDGSMIGDWSFDEIAVSRDEDEIHVLAEGEELVLVSGDIWFARAMAQSISKPAARPSPEVSPVEVPDDGGDVTTASTTPADEDSARPSRRRGAHRKRGSFKFKW